MITSIGGVIFEAKKEDINIFDILSTYINLLKTDIDNNIEKALKNTTIKPIEFSSIGISFDEKRRGIYNIKEIEGFNTKKKAKEVIGDYNIIVSKVIDIGLPKTDNLLESYDERDGGSAESFEIISNIERYCSNYYNKSIKGICRFSDIAINDLDIICGYNDGCFYIEAGEETPEAIKRLSGKYKLNMLLTCSIQCSLLPA